MTAARRAIGVDIGGTKIAAGIVDDRGTVVGEVLTMPTPVSEGRDAIVAAVVALERQLTKHTTGVTAIGIASAGVFDDHGTVTSATDLLPDWTGTSLAADVGAATQLPTTAINDVHAAGLAEASCGAGRGLATVLMVAVGTGIGGAIVRRGVVDSGRSGTSGSVGHVPVSWAPARTCSCGVEGHLEPLASGPGIERSYLELAGTERSLREIAASDGETSRRVILQGAAILGEALAGVANVIDPDVIVIGGGVAQVGDLYLDAVRHAYTAHCLPGPRTTPLVPASLGTSATLVGGALRALRC